jgi:hypothetical protein
MMNSSSTQRAQLKALYARLSTIDNLIASLQAYDRYRATTPTPGQQRRSA